MSGPRRTARGGAVVAVLVLAAAAPAADAAPGDRLVTFQVRTTFVEPSPAMDGVSCRGPASRGVAPDTCRQRVTGVSFFSGTLHGREEYELEAWLLPDGRVGYEGTAVFARSGGVVGCGRGGFTIDVTDGVVDYPATDPSTRATPGQNRWRVRPGSGTGQLADRLVGGGGGTTWTSRTERAGTTANDYGEGVFTGTVTCRLPR